jgi:Helix-turn-helix domain
MNNPLSTEEKQHIRVLLLAGQSHNAIAKQVGRSQSTVSAFATREGISPANPAPRVAIERRKEFALEARLEATGELMAKVLEIAEIAESGREIKECAVAWGVLCDKSAIMEGLSSSRTETHKTRGAGTINLEEEFARLDKLQDEAVEREQRERFGVSEYGRPGPRDPGLPSD